MSCPCVLRASLTFSLLAYLSVARIVCNPELGRAETPTARCTTQEQSGALGRGGARAPPPALLQEEGGALVRLGEDAGRESDPKAESSTRETKWDSTGSLRLTKELLPELLQEVAHYLGVTRLLILTHHHDEGMCMAVIRSLYLRGVSSSCTSSVSTTCCHSAVVFLANQQDSGGGANEEVRQVSKAVNEGRLETPHLVVLLQENARFLPPSSYRMRFCVLQPKGDAVEFREVLTFGSDSAVEHVVGRWRPGLPGRLPFRRNVIGPRDFQGNTVRFSVIQVPPYVFLEKEANGTLRLSGYLVDIILLLQQQLNFTIEWVESPDTDFGVPAGNDSWTGLVGELHRQAAEVALVPLSYTLLRSSVIDFSPPIDYSKNRLLVYNSRRTVFTDWSTYTLGFHWTVWIMTVGVWAVMGAGIAKMAKPNDHVSIYDYMFSFAGAFAQQGCEVVPECFRGRLVFLTFWMGAVLLYHSYTARLTSQLAVVNTIQPFTSLADAINRAGYTIAAQKGTSHITALKNSKEHTMKLLYSQLMADPSLLVSSDREGMILLQQSRKKIAFFQSLNAINYEIRGNCSYMWVGPEYFKEFFHLGYQKNLPFANALSSNIRRATEGGLLEKLMNKWWGKQINCSIPASFHQLDFTKTISAFVLLIIGAAVSVLFLFAETSLCYFRPCGTLRKLFEGECTKAKRRRHLRKASER